MPNINIRTNVAVTDSQSDAIREFLGKAITILPGKTEEYLMVSILPQAKMYFKGSDAPCAMIEVQLLGSAGAEYYEKMTSALCGGLSRLLGIKPDRIYTKYEEYKYWGCNGRNF